MDQAIAVAGFVITQDDAGLFAVSAAFGFGFSGLIPAYILTARQLFPAHEASWRIPTLLLTGMSGMGAGSWLAGVIYDHYGFYALAFATGLAFNIANFVIIAGLVILWRGRVCRLDPYKKPLRNCFTRSLERKGLLGRTQTVDFVCFMLLFWFTWLKGFLHGEGDEACSALRACIDRPPISGKSGSRTQGSRTAARLGARRNLPGRWH